MGERLPAASCSGASVVAARPRRALPARAVVWLGAAAFCGAAASLALAERSSGGYTVGTWGPGALALLSLLVAFLLAGLRAHRPVTLAAGCLLLTGLWAAVSPSWGGLPDEAWTMLDRSVAAAAALLVGAMVAGAVRRSGLVPAAVLVAAVVQAVEILVRLAHDGGPRSWFEGRILDGPVGYHNAQAAVFLVGLPVALWAADGERLAARAAGGAAAVLLLGPLLLTQSRSAVGALALALAVQVVLARSATTALTAAAVVAAGIVLVGPLQRVDAALVAGDGADRTGSFTVYGLYVGIAAALVGLVAAAGRRPRPLRASILAAVLAIAVAVGALGAVGAGVAPHPDRLVSELTSDASPNGAPAGTTRMATLALNGRRDAWRVAASMAAREPLTGEGQGTFARRWTVERRLLDLYILQPHSFELELLAELGVVGLALMAGFAGFAVASTRGAGTPRRQAAAVAVLVGLLGQASVDWTWSFTAIVAAGLLAVGGLAQPARWARSGLPLGVAGAFCCGLAAVAVLGPLLSHRQLVRATTLQQRQPTAAWSHAERALAFDPWNEDARSLEGRLAEASDLYRLAAARYRSAGAVSQRPWLAAFREARVLRRLGAARAADAACRRAAAGNPAELLLHRGPCAREELGAAHSTLVPGGLAFGRISQLRTPPSIVSGWTSGTTTTTTGATSPRVRWTTRGSR